MSLDTSRDEPFTDGFIGVSPSELESKKDSELAEYQSLQISRTAQDILAEREWQRRMISHQLKEQYNLDARLAEQAEKHTELIAKGTRLWSAAIAIIGVVGTLAGTFIGIYLGEESKQASQGPPPLTQQSQRPISPNTSKLSAASSSTQTSL